MNTWPGTRPITIVSACMTRSGLPHFAVNQVQATHAEFQNGIHYYLAEADLLLAGYEEPFVHFDETEAPAFLIPAVRQHLDQADAQPTLGVLALTENH
jgi:hypothetical protein